MTTITPHRLTPEWTKALVLLGAFALYAVGALIPLPGVDPAAIAGTTVASGRVSIFALGVSPLVSAILVIEIARLAVPAFARWSVAPRGAFSLQSAAWIFGLLLAAFQSFNLAEHLEVLRGAVADPGASFEAEAVVTTVGATALLGWIGLHLTRAEAGDGLLVLYAAPMIVTVARRFLAVMPALSAGGGASWLPAIAIDCVAAALLVAGALASRPQPKAALGFGGGLLDPIPAMIASAVASAPAIILTNFVWPDSGLDPWTAGALTLATAAALIALTATMRAALPGAGAPRPLPWPAILATIVVCVGMPIVAAFAPSLLLINGYWLVFIVAAALSVLGALGLLQRSRGASKGAD
jgi:preprotein translocase subunit SecY